MDNKLNIILMTTTQQKECEFSTGFCVSLSLIKRGIPVQYVEACRAATAFWVHPSHSAVAHWV